MITDLLIGIGAMAVLFVIAGVVGMNFWRGCGHDHCDACANDCEIDTERRHP